MGEQVLSLTKHQANDVCFKTLLLTVSARSYVHGHVMPFSDTALGEDFCYYLALRGTDLAVAAVSIAHAWQDLAHAPSVPGE